MISNNRLANVTNRFQTPTHRVLCVCSAGLLRSPTAANVLHQEYGFNTRAAGIAVEYALIPVDEALIEWADEIVWVERDVFEEGKQAFDLLLADKTNTVLAIPDRYEWNHPELRAIIKEQYDNATSSEKVTC